MSGKDKPMRLLILGGTTEARLLAERLAGVAAFDVTLSLAGRTQAPLSAPVTVRSGGFGGIDGLRRFLAASAIDRVIDATHPFAARIKANASRACHTASVPLLALVRQPWARLPGDRWIEVDDVESAVAALGSEARCVFLTIGRAELAAFEAAPQHRYLVRSVDAPGAEIVLLGAHFLQARGPFGYAEEIELMRNYAIEIVVSKNSGGDPTYAKIEAARRLNIPVVMIERPRLDLAAPRPEAHSIEQALAWLAHDPSP